jgi:hypothetical protein
MFVRTLTALAMVGASVLATPTVALAAPAASAASGSTCSGLAKSYDQVEKSLAMTYAEGVGDNSAVRETNRQTENSNDLAKASIVISLMQAHHCTLPDHAPTMGTYISDALTCATDRLKGTADAPSCKMENWQPTK